MVASSQNVAFSIIDWSAEQVSSSNNKE